jgi:phage-related protein
MTKEKLYERPATRHAIEKCSECVNDCKLKNIKGNCKAHSPKESK